MIRIYASDYRLDQNTTESALIVFLFGSSTCGNQHEADKKKKELKRRKKKNVDLVKDIGFSSKSKQKRITLKPLFILFLLYTFFL